MNKVRHNQDGTLARNNVKYWLRLIREYELIKDKKHLQFKFVGEFYSYYGLTRQNFIKYYNRFKRNNCNSNYLLPQKRDPRYKLRRTPRFIEQKVLNLSSKGLSRYEIFAILEEKSKSFTPCASTIYNSSKRHNLGRLKVKEKRSKRTIIKEKAGELGHIDCHYLPKGLIDNDNNRYYLVAIIDSLTRVAWAGVINNIKSITVMFNALKALNMIKSRYDIKFSEIISDNGSEFGSGPKANNKEEHPFELLLKEMGIKHRYTRPYRLEHIDLKPMVKLKGSGEL